MTFATPDAGKVLLWNATGTAVTNGPDADEVTSAQSYATAAAASAAAAAASAATVPDFPEITGNGGKYLKANAGATALEYGALGTAALATLGTSANNALQLDASAKLPSSTYDFSADATGTETTKPTNAAGVAGLIAALVDTGSIIGALKSSTRAMNAANGTVNYALSGESRTPVGVIIFGSLNSAANCGIGFSNGTYHMTLANVPGGYITGNLPAQ